MWKQPRNIPADDWQRLTQAWERRRGDVYARFQKHTDVPADEIDRIMAELLGIYYRTEQHVEEGADFDAQLKDEFHKGHWVEGEIVKLRTAFPALREKAPVRYINEILDATLADKCMGGIVKAFIEITAEVCAGRFGKPYGDKPKALRNGILERSSWEKIQAEYDEMRRRHKEDPDAPAPVIYRQ